MTASILLVDDEPSIRFSFTRYLSRTGFQVAEAPSLNDARQALTRQRFDAILLDLSLPDGNGLDWIGEIRSLHTDVAIIVITGVGDIPSAVEAMRRGADHFLTKPVNMGDLEVFLVKSLELGNLRRKSSLQRRLAKVPEPFFGESHAIHQTLALLKAGANSESIILFQGETGTGKGVLARWLHYNGPRSSMPFVELNCSSLRGELLSNELFGHVRGAFTTAVETRQGLLDVADGGTLFLDEIGDMDLAVQSQFLKVLDEKKYRRLGDVQERGSDFRLICATNKNLMTEVNEGRFRKDLFFRIHVLIVDAPPLRERVEDIPGLAAYLLRGLGFSSLKITADAMNILLTYSWPGNIRELRNVLERGILLGGKQGALMPQHFPGLSVERFVNVAEQTHPGELAQKIRKALDRNQGDKRKAADSLGMSRATFYRRLKEFRIGRR